MAALFVSIISTGCVHAQEGKEGALWELLNTLDSSISSIRRGNTSGAKMLLERASGNYSENFNVENHDNALNTEIIQAFSSLSQNPIEENIFVLRTKVLRAAGLIGVSLSPIYAYSMFIILGISAVVSLLITLLSKRMVNWDLVRESKAKISEYQKELREAMSKRDMKRVHKVQQRQDEIRKLSAQVMTQTLKPTIIYIIPLILLWMILSTVYTGWVVAWLPFRINIPIIAPEGLVAFGMGWWYFITFLGFSHLSRKILIRE